MSKESEALDLRRSLAVSTGVSRPAPSGEPVSSDPLKPRTSCGSLQSYTRGRPLDSDSGEALSRTNKQGNVTVSPSKRGRAVGPRVLPSVSLPLSPRETTTDRGFPRTGVTRRLVCADGTSSYSP